MQSCPVIVPTEPSPTKDFSNVTTLDLIKLSESELAAVDPCAVNLIVAREIEGNPCRDIAEYQQILDEWANDFTCRVAPVWAKEFEKTPQDWSNDWQLFNFGMLHQYISVVAGVSYHPEYSGRPAVFYTDPSVVFLNGVLDTKYATCGSVASLYHAMAWRLGWAVSLATVNAHYIVRYDDGEKIYNINPVPSLDGWSAANNDERYIEKWKLSPLALSSGSDLRALLPHEVLGTHIGLKARHYLDCGRVFGDPAMTNLAEREFLLARYLFPNNRWLYRNQAGLSMETSKRLFAPDEPGHLNSIFRPIHAQPGPRRRQHAPPPRPVGFTGFVTVNTAYTVSPNRKKQDA